MDNATAEYTFISTFFTPSPLPPSEPPQSSFMRSSGPQSLLSPDGTITDIQSPAESDYGSPRPLSTAMPTIGGTMPLVAKSKDEQTATDAAWKQVMEPVMEYCQVSVLDILE